MIHLVNKCCRREVPEVVDYKIPKNAAHKIAVGLYQNISGFIKAADKEDYEKFKAEFIKHKEQQAADSPQVKRRRSRKTT